MPLSKREVRRLGPDWQKSYPVFSMSLPFILFHLICEGLIKIITDVAIWAQTLFAQTSVAKTGLHWLTQTPSLSHMKAVLEHEDMPIDWHLGEAVPSY